MKLFQHKRDNFSPNARIQSARLKGSMSRKADTSAVIDSLLAVYGKDGKRAHEHGKPFQAAEIHSAAMCLISNPRYTFDGCKADQVVIRDIVLLMRAPVLIDIDVSE